MIGDIATELRKLAPSKYRAVVADPPWQFSDRGSRATPLYDLMGLGAIKALDVREVTQADSLLFLWVPSSFLDEGLKVAEAWGYDVKTTIVWCKVAASGAPLIGMGHYVRCAHELVLVGSSGKAATLIKDHGVASWFTAPRGQHSAKPEALQDLVERLVDGPYLELFARRRRDKWTCLGNQLEPELRDTA